MAYCRNPSMAAAMDAPPAAVVAGMALKRGMQVPLAQRTARHAPQAKPNLAQTNEDVYAPEVALSAESTTDQVLEGIRLDGKHALVTGATGGLGIETARALASAGASVTIGGRSPGKIASALETLRAEVPDASFDAIADFLPGLVDLCAFGCRRLTDRGLAALSGLTCENLRKLNTVGAYKCTDAAMQCLLTSHPTILLYHKPEKFGENFS